MRQNPRQEPFRQPDPLKESKDTFVPGKRKFVLGAAAATALKLSPVSAFGQQVERPRTQKEEKRGFNESIEHEKAKVQADIVLGLVGQDEYEKWLAQHHIQRRTPWLGLLREVNPIAEQLRKNDASITTLAAARAFYRATAEEVANVKNKELPYWHNLAAAYLELENTRKDQVVAKLVNLFKYAQLNKIDVSTIRPELTMYSLVDHAFNFSLSPTALEAELEDEFPTWKQYPPTHEDKDSYEHYNDLSVLDIFELNRLIAVMAHLEHQHFVADVFKYRDADVKDTRTGFGGVIPLPYKGYHLQAIPADTVGNNNRYVIPERLLVEMFASAATFRFNATTMKEPPENHGPSADDHAFFAPGVVFSSIDESTILVHFYTSTEPKDNEPVKNKVICLGVIRRPALPVPEEKKRKPAFPNLA